MNTIQAKIPAYGMPALEGPVNKPEKVNMMPPMGDMPGPGEPGGPGDMPPMPGAPAEIKPCPPTCRPSEHPGSVPGADVEPGKPGPGFPGGGPPKAPPFPRMESMDVLDGRLYLAETPYAEMTVEKYAKAVSIEAIKDHGYDAAVGMTDDAFLFELQSNVTGRFYDYLNTGTLSISETTWQRALAMAKGSVINKFKAMHRTATDIVGFVNVMDLYSERVRVPVHQKLHGLRNCVPAVRRGNPAGPGHCHTR